MIKIFQNFKKKGFSLVELMMSTVILLMLATLIVPNPAAKVKIGKEAKLLEILDDTRKALTDYKNDFGYFPKVAETYSYLNFLYRVQSYGAGVLVPSNEYSDINIPPAQNTLLTVLEASLLEPQNPEKKRVYMRELENDPSAKYRPPYLRGSGKTSAEIIWNILTRPRGFYLNPFTRKKIDWELYIRFGSDNSKSGWYKIDTPVLNGMPADPLTPAAILFTNYDFPPDSDDSDNINESCEIIDIRFAPSGTDGEKPFYKALNSEYGEYYYEW